MKIDQPFVEDDTDGSLAIAEGNDPDPVTEAGVVVRSQTPRADVARCQHAVARGDVIDVAEAVPAAPDRGHRMRVIALNQAAAPSQTIHASACVEKPAAGERAA